jgi:hypothetical protein
LDITLLPVEGVAEERGEADGVVVGADVIGNGSDAQAENSGDVFKVKINKISGIDRLARKKAAVQARAPANVNTLALVFLIVCSFIVMEIC